MVPPLQHPGLWPWAMLWCCWPATKAAAWGYRMGLRHGHYDGPLQEDGLFSLRVSLLHPRTTAPGCCKGGTMEMVNPV